MSIPIPLNLPNRDPREELFARLQNAPMQHAEALLSAYEAIQCLHDRGVFDLMRGALGSGDDIVNEIVKVASAPESVRSMRNFTILLQAFGNIDPNLLQALIYAIPEAFTEAKAQEAHPPGFWAIINKFRDKNLRLGLALVNALLERFGSKLSARKSSD